MAALTGKQLARNVQEMIGELKYICMGIGEEKASQAPQGPWSPKEILSRLLGPEGSGYPAIFKGFLDRENAATGLEPGTPFYSGTPSRTAFAAFLAEVEKECDGISRFAEGPSGEHFDRKAHVPMFKESPLGEDSTLESMFGGLRGYFTSGFTPTTCGRSRRDRGRRGNRAPPALSACRSSRGPWLRLMGPDQGGNHE